MQQLIPLTEPDKMQAAGLPFESTDSARWCHRHAEERGLGKAFVRIGRRVYVDPAKFHELVRENAGVMRSHDDAAALERRGVGAPRRDHRTGNATDIARRQCTPSRLRSGARR